MIRRSRLAVMPETATPPLSEAREQSIRAELAGLLQSPAFRTSKRCRDFLEYVVHQTLRGETDSLKERSIGVDLFHLPPNFDAGQHTIVRVTANEIRKKLAQHYMQENGSSHPVRIELPPGSYRAEFRWETPTTPLTPATPQTQPQRRLWFWLLRIAVAVAVIAGAILLWRVSSAEPSPLEPARPGPLNAPASGTTLEREPIRMIVGATSTYLDRSGRTWGPDRFFTGGLVLFRPAERVLRTLDPDIYRRARVGEFRYDIPLPPGSYEMRLHFAETGLADFISAESSGEGQRVFRVLANGVTILDAFDVVADAAGPNISNERVFRDISPDADGMLHLTFATMRGSPMVSALELLPVDPGEVRPVRIRAGWTTSWQDEAGKQWQSDSYFLGGNALVRSTNPAREGAAIAHDSALYNSERWGHFSYAVPVADGRYRVTLKFCEGHYGRRNSGAGGAGSRVFDVYCNGVALLRNFDIYKEAGGEGLPLDRTFSGVRPTAQGKIVLAFVPVVGMACVNGIEVVEERN
jgi:hypothetical protein